MKNITKMVAVALTLVASSLQAQWKFEQVSYVGALEADASKDWTKNWTNWTPKTTTYADPTDTTTLNGAAAGTLNITNTLTLDASKVYLLKGLIVVKSGGDLVIPAGTLIRCKADITASPKNYATVVVERGGQIHINGTEAKPVVFTSYKNTGRDRGDWGGIALCGKSPNNQGTDVQLEGFNNVSFDNTLAKGGGTTDDDNSGSITYCRIEFGGFAFEPNKEINGLTFNSVGNKTVIDNVQVAFSGDDSYEWFGGSVLCKHLIAYNGTDDDFDTDFGYRGAVQFAIGHKDTSYYDLSYNLPSGASTSEGFESDNDAGGSGKLPLTSAVFSNVTMVGPVPVGSTYSALSATARNAFRRGIRIRRNSRLSIVNSIFMGYRNFVMFDGDSTLKAAGVMDTSSGYSFPKNNLFRNNIIVNTTSAFGPASTTANGLAEVASNNTAYLKHLSNWIKASTNSNRVDPVAYTAGTLLVDPKNPTAPDFKPVTGSPALSGSNFSLDRLNDFGVVNSVKTLNTISGVNISPNPASSSVMIDFDSETSMQVKIQILNMAGAVVKDFGTQSVTKGMNVMSLDISHMQSGMYLVRIASNGGFYSSRLMIQK
ncbi:MAG: T9SS type A sorting domain-containing protein [Bacteroidetes bacterium]|nr:T9SS type A sorting domain-containing protein [Bacteroidota bacterium]